MNNNISPLRILPAEVAPQAAAGASSALSKTPDPSLAGEGQDSFLTTLQDSMDAAQGAQGAAASQVAQLLNGKGGDLHSAMIAVEKADLSFQLMMQVRNKIVQAYQQISNMQF
jgi:flagellar hook-basal body complex protein FliE